MKTAILWQFIVDHQLAFYAALGAAIDAMDDPTPKNGPFYVWFFKLTHSLMLRFRTAANASNQDRRGNGTPKP